MKIIGNVSVFLPRLYVLQFFGVIALVCLLGGCGDGKLDNEKSDKIVSYARTTRIRGFDPIKAGDVASALAIARIYEGLVQYSYLVRPYRVEPCLAESLPEISKDGLIYTFKLRKGIYFQDDLCFTETGGKGRELIAEDFVYSIKRVADLKNESTGYWAYNDRITGLDEFRSASGREDSIDYDTEVEGLKAIDRYTFQIKLKRPYPQLLWILTMHYAYAVPREAVEYYGDDFVNHPAGTGPYVLKSWWKNYRIEFERNPKWAETGRVELYPDEGAPGDAEKGLLKDAGKPIPFVDHLVRYVIDDQSTEWLKFVAGELDAMGYISRDNFDVVIAEGELAKSLREKNVQLFTAPALDVFYIGFNMDDPVVGHDAPGENRKKKLRQALSCTFNSEAWVSFWNDRAVRAKGPIPPSVAGYEEKPTPYPFDLEKARKLLAEAGYPDGISSKTGKRLQLKIELGSADPQTRESTELTGAFMREIGVILEPVYNNWPTFLRKMERRQCQLYRLGWIADYPDAENFLQLFYGDNESPGPNHSNYKNSEFDRIYEKIRVMSNSPERTELYKQMADIIIEDCPWIFMHHQVDYAPYHHWLGNFKGHDFPYGMGKYRRIDQKARGDWRKIFGKTHWKK
ncbi:ABC transporter substrate-binding protein [Verrucomicrobiota bacterium]